MAQIRHLTCAALAGAIAFSVTASAVSGAPQRGNARPANPPQAHAKAAPPALECGNYLGFQVLLDNQGFSEGRDAGGRPHEAVDILAPRNTPIHAVEDGTIAKLFDSKAGGLTIYQYDPSGRLCYYYAHLEVRAGASRWAARVTRGRHRVRRHLRKCAGEHAASSLCGVRAGGGSALVEGAGNRPVLDISALNRVK